MDAVIIGNPNSGRAGNRERLKRYAEIIGSGGLDVEVWNTERPDHATELATRAGDKIVIAAGGDGTANEVVNGLSKDATLGVIPLGTANVFARELGLPMKPEEVCERIRDGEVSPIDVGIATDREGTERKFTCMAGMGFDANVVNEVTPGLKRYLKVLAFPLAALKVYLQGDIPNLHVIQGDTTYVTQFAIVANGHYYGGDFRVTDSSTLTTGSLEVILVDRVGRLLRADVLTRILAKKPLDRSMRSFATGELRAKSPSAEIPVQIDGEIWGHLPMSFRIEPAALKVVR